MRIFLTARKRSLRWGRGVWLWSRGCLPLAGGGCLPLVWGGEGWCTPPRHRHTPRQALSLGRHTPSTTGYGQQAGGTHPTGMHSCLQKSILQQENKECSCKNMIQFP